MVAVVSHDAGGAEVVSSFVRRERLPALFVLEGPARTVFERKLGPVTLTPLEEAIEACTSVIVGTSGQSTLEHSAIGIARAHNKPSAAFLDHWINYIERFTRGGETHLPDEIWVGDAIALALAREAFIGLPVRLVDNPYFAEVREEFAAIGQCRREPAEGLSVLYVAEPLHAYALAQFGDKRHYGYIEDDALRYFLEHIGILEAPVARIRIRPHPSEPRAKYDWAGDEFHLPIETDGNATLVEDIASSDIVVGCESMAMAVALLAGKRVISCIPPGGRRCRLPHAEIQHLQQLLALRPFS